MGAKVWKRDDAGGQTFSVGGGKSPGHSVAATGKRKNVWSRDTQQSSAHANAAPPAQPLASSSAPSPAATSDTHPAKRRRSATFSEPATRTTASQGNSPPHHSNGSARPQTKPSPASQPSTSKASPAEGAPGETNERPSVAATPPGIGLARQLQRKQSEMERLKQAMYAQQRKMHYEQEALKRAEAVEQQRLKGEREEAERRRQRLEAGFSQAFRQEREEHAAAGKGRKVALVADAREVERVLATRSDYDCLQLKAGASAAVIRKKYKDMAVTLHPDKCKVEGSIDAFRRIVQAQQNLLKYAI